MRGVRTFADARTLIRRTECVWFHLKVVLGRLTDLFRCLRPGAAHVRQVMRSLREYFSRSSCTYGRIRHLSARICTGRPCREQVATIDAISASKVAIRIKNICLVSSKKRISLLIPSFEVVRQVKSLKVVLFIFVTQFFSPVEKLLCTLSDIYARYVSRASLEILPCDRNIKTFNLNAHTQIVSCVAQNVASN